MPELNATIFKLKLTDWYRHSETLLPFTPQLTKKERRASTWLMGAWKEYAYSEALADAAADAIDAMAAADQAHAGNLPLKDASAAFRGIATVVYCSGADVYAQFQRALCCNAGIPIPTLLFSATPAPAPAPPQPQPNPSSPQSTPSSPSTPSGPAAGPIAVTGIKFKPLDQTNLIDNVFDNSSWIDPYGIFPYPDGQYHTVEYTIRDHHGRIVAHKGPKRILVDQTAVPLPFLFKILKEGSYRLTLTIDGYACQPHEFWSFQAPSLAASGSCSETIGCWLGGILVLVAAFFILKSLGVFARTLFGFF